MTSREMFEDIRTYLIEELSDINVKFNMSRNPDELKPRLIIIRPQEYDDYETFEGDKDSYVYIYVHEKDILSCIELRESIEYLLSDYCAEQYRVLTVSDSEKFQGEVIGQPVVVERIRIKIMQS